MRRFGRNILSMLLAVSLLAVTVPVGIVLADDGQPQPPQDTLIARVAEILGIDQKALENAIDQAQQEQEQKALENRLDQMVEKGLITKEQAQAIKDWIKARPNVPGLGRIFRGGALRLWDKLHADGEQQDTLLSRVAEILGIDQQTLENAFKQARQEQQEKKLDEWLKKLVEKGVLTEEQAKAYKEWLESRPEGIPFMPGGRPGIGPGRWGKHMMPWNDNQPNNNTGTSTQNKPATVW